MVGGGGGGGVDADTDFAEDDGGTLSRKDANVFAALEAVGATAGLGDENGLESEAMEFPNKRFEGDGVAVIGKLGDEVGGVKEKGLELLAGEPKPLNAPNFNAGGVAGAYFDIR